MRVVDQGPGIPPAEQERIFMPFYGAGGSGPRPGDRARLRRGQRRPRRASSRCPGQGTSFVVELPLPDGRAGAGVKRVLVLDDEPQILRALRVVLREAGFEAIPADDRRGGARPRGGPAARRRDRRPRAAGRRRRRGHAAAARVERDADHRALGGRRRGGEGARARGRRRRLRHQAVRPARAGRAPAGGAAARRRRPGASRRSTPTASRSTSPPASCASTGRRST